MAAENQDGVNSIILIKKSTGTPPIRTFSNSFLMQNVGYWPKEHFQPFKKVIEWKSKMASKNKTALKNEKILFLLSNGKKLTKY
jgi:hypothetical protein